MSANECAARKRDKRVDDIGFAKELIAQFVEPTIDDIKATHPDDGTLLEGDYFDGHIVKSGGSLKDVSEVDPSAFLLMLNTGRITREQFVRAIAVDSEEAKKILGEEKFAKVATNKRKRSPSVTKLLVTRKKGVEESLIVAIREVKARFAESLLLTPKGRAA